MERMTTNVENTYKRANELVEVGQKVQALNLLFDLFQNRRQLKRMWTKTHEDAMMLFVRLCVDLKDNRVARDGLHAYRAIAQTHAPGSLEAVITYMLDISDEKVVKAMSQCSTNRDVSRIVDDLEEGGGSPEAMLLATVASERDRVRSEQAILVPWLKFDWENLRSVLDISKNNIGLEQTYHTTAHRAFNFCKTYGRKVEFRRLCELLRGHLQHQTKGAREGDEAGKLTAESMELHLGTRFEQLKVATALHLWIEGFRTIEDIHSIISLSSRKPSAQLMATYYQKLTQMFLVSGSFLFHAFAFRSYYELSRERNKSLTQDQIKSMATSVILAAMSIPLPAVASSSAASTSAAAQTESNLQKEKNRRMAQLLGFDQINPDRETLLKALRTSKVLEDCSAEARELYQALESQAGFDPQNLVKRCAPKIAAIRADPKLEAYAAPIETLLIIRLISQLGRVFQSVKLGEFHEMIDQLGGSISRLDAEKLVVKAVRSRQIPMRHGSSDIKIDHASGTIRFGENALEEQRTRDSLSDLSKRLADVCKELKRGPFAASATPGVAAATSLAALPTAQIVAKIAEDQAKIVQRKALIAARKQELDDLTTFRTKVRVEREEAARKARVERDEANAANIAEIKRKHDEERIREQIKYEEERKKIQDATKVLGSDAENMSPEERERLLKEKQEKQMQQALEAEKKIQSRAKRLDAWIRAMREAEKGHLQKEHERRKIADREDFALETSRALQVAKEKHVEGLALKESFAKIQPYRDAFENVMQPIWKKNVENARSRYLREREDRKREEKLARARMRRDEDQRRRRQEEEAAKRAEMEAKRILQSEEDNRRKEELKAQIQAETAAQTSSSEGRYRPKVQVEASMDDSYQGRSRREPFPSGDGRPSDRRDDRSGGGPLRRQQPPAQLSTPPPTSGDGPSASSRAEPKEGEKKIWRPKFRDQ